MATTTGGTPYVTSTDLVANYPTTSLSLANRTDVVASGGPVLVKTAGYTITVADILAGNRFLYNSASAGTFTLPSSSLVDGMTIEVAQIGAGAVTVSTGTIVGTTTTSSQYQALRLVYVAASTTWYSVAESTPAGISLISPTSLANTSGTATASGGAVTFTGVSSLSLNGIFTTTYDVYRINVQFTAFSANPAVYVRLRSSGTDNSSSYRTETIENYGTTVSAATNANGDGTKWSLATNASSTYAEDTGAVIEMLNPALAKFTLGYCQMGVRTSSGVFDAFRHSYFHEVSTAYDGISLFTSTGTMSGVIRVFGFKNS
jgi:hypothetical protein